MAKSCDLMIVRALAASVLAAMVMGSGYVSKTGTMSVTAPCPLRLAKVTLEPGKGFDRDSLYANFVLSNASNKEFLFTYKLLLRSGTNHSEVAEQVGASPILPHSKGLYREFLGVQFTNPAKYTLQQVSVSCVSTSSQ